MTLPQLQKEIESSFHDKPHQEVLACVRDVKSWLDNSLCEMSFHSFQHQFWYVFYSDIQLRASYK